MRSTGHVARMGKRGSKKFYGRGESWGKGPTGDPGIDGRIIEKWSSVIGFPGYELDRAGSG